MPTLKPVRWIGSARKDLRSFPDLVRQAFGFAIYAAQSGSKAYEAKVLRGFGDAGVLEVVEDFDGSTFRAVYAVRFSDVVYVLHVFQKKARRGIATDQKDIELIRARLKRAEEDHRSRQP